jgi:hypothetical protein
VGSCDMGGTERDGIDLCPCNKSFYIDVNILLKDFCCDT